MKPDLPPAVQALAASVLDGRGHTDPALRRAVADQAKAAGLAPSIAGAPRTPAGEGEPAPAVPPELGGYVDKVARHAYRITDEDVAALRAAGHDEDAIFEVTISAALGAALVRMERGLLALKGAR